MAGGPRTSRAPLPPEGWSPLVRARRLARRPLERFLAIEASSGILLFVASLAALGLANSPWAADYHAILETPFGIRIGELVFERPLHWVVNDGLMAIFFFVVGLEIRREIAFGELSEWRRAVLPMAAALGGMVVPALVYLGLAGAPATRDGWGVPMATDIAFAVGVVTVLGRRVSPALRVLLLALAVIDDLGAILVIALFYSQGVSLSGFAVAGLGLAAILGMQRAGVRSKWAYVVPGVVVWAGVYAAGVHPTIAGVVVGFVTPVRAWLGPDGFADDTRHALETLRSDGVRATSHELGGILRRIDAARREAMSPAESLIETLHPFVAFGIMPIFALVNAGVTIDTSTLDAEAIRTALGAGVGLVVGKPIGVLVACGIVLASGLARLPAGLGPRHVVVLGVVAGIGFTMSLFIAQLAFTSPALLAAAKLGVLAASVLAAVLTLVVGRTLPLPDPVERAAVSADEAESSTEL